MRILMTWEIGDGLGHIAPHRPLLQELKKQGHEVFVIMRFLNSAHQLFADDGIPTFPAPFILVNGKDAYQEVSTYSSIIHNFGYNRVDTLKSLFKSWLDYLDVLKPDLVLTDYSPSALTAAKMRGIKTIRMGGGYFCPTVSYPMVSISDLNMRQVMEKDPEDIKHEDFIFGNITQAIMDLGYDAGFVYSKFSCLADVFNADDQILLGVKELDHMVNRANREPIGIMRNDGFPTIQWPKGDKKLFFYTYNHIALPAIFKWIQQCNYAAIVRGNNLPEEIAKQFTSENIVFSKDHLNISQLAHEADVCINNGNFSTTVEFLLGGAPTYILPTHAEQATVGMNVCNEGLGLMTLNNNPMVHIGGIHQLLTDPGFKRRATEFAEKYSHINNEYYMQRAMEIISRN